MSQFAATGSRSTCVGSSTFLPVLRLGDGRGCRRVPGPPVFLWLGPVCSRSPFKVGQHTGTGGGPAATRATGFCNPLQSRRNTETVCGDPLPALPLRSWPALSVCWRPWPSPCLPAGAVACAAAVLAVPPDCLLRIAACAHLNRSAAGLGGGGASLAPPFIGPLRRAWSH